MACTSFQDGQADKLTNRGDQYTYMRKSKISQSNNVTRHPIGLQLVQYFLIELQKSDIWDFFDDIIAINRFEMGLLHVKRNILTYFCALKL